MEADKMFLELPVKGNTYPGYLKDIKEIKEHLKLCANKEHCVEFVCENDETSEITEGEIKNITHTHIIINQLRFRKMDKAENTTEYKFVEIIPSTKMLNFAHSEPRLTKAIIHFRKLHINPADDE